jgi:hypothetical protein
LLSDEIPDAEKNLDYLQKTWMYFFIMLNKSFGLSIQNISPVLSLQPKQNAKNSCFRNTQNGHYRPHANNHLRPVVP